MADMTVGEFALMMGGEVVGVDPRTAFDGFCLDHREARPGALFLAIRGAKVDGHDFVEQAVREGCVAAVVEREVGGPQVRVSSLVDALARYATLRRREFTGSVIGVTGSVGKTMTKELLAAALSPLGPVLSNPGSRNTEYTLPLLWHELGPEHRAVVAEMGMRGFGQIAHLASFSQPTVGVVTNVGVAHAALVGGPVGIARAKGELLRALPSSGVAVIPDDVPHRDVLLDGVTASIVTFGDPLGDAAVVDVETLSWNRSRAAIRVGGEVVDVELPFIGRPLARNAAATLLAAHIVGVSLSDAAAGLKGARVPPNRMEVRQIYGATVLLDAYNSGPPSVAAALEAIASFPFPGRLWVVLGDMRELGDLAVEAHRTVGRKVAQLSPYRAVYIGEFAEDYRRGSSEVGMPSDQILIVNSREEIAAILQEVAPGDVVLIKASRALELEKVLTIWKQEGLS